MYIDRSRACREGVDRRNIIKYSDSMEDSWNTAEEEEKGWKRLGD